MGHKSKKRRVAPIVPIGKAPSVSSKPVTSLKLARKLTSKFHSLLNEEASLKSGIAVTKNSLSAGERVERLKTIAAEIEGMGGRDAYQEASALATKHFRSSRFVFKNLVRYGLQPKRGEAPLKVLEIGAVNAQLVVCPWMKVRAIDITSRDPKHIEQKDFFDIPVVDAAAGEYDVIVNAMVINCVPDLMRRGEMILRCHDHLKPGGLMFFALPSRCIDMSEFFTRQRFENLLTASGFTIRDDHRTPKISFYILQRTDGINLISSDKSGVAPWQSSFMDDKARETLASSVIDSVPTIFFAGTGRLEAFRARAADAVSDPYHAESSDSDDDHAHNNYDDGAAAGAGSKRGRAKPKSKDTSKDHVINADALGKIAEHLGEAAAAYAVCHQGAKRKWQPIIFSRTPKLDSWINKLTPPPKTLSRGELPVTGFTRTDFVICIPPEWVRKTFKLEAAKKPA